MVPIEYLRQFRFGEYAIFDFAAALLGFLILSPLLSWLFQKAGIKIPKKNWLFLALPISIPAHILANNITPMTRDFLDLNGHYILKFVVIGLLLLGLKGVKIMKKK